ncbi:hypothetical protein GCM10022243_17750 [Saccharothrix violaceirubra]|uniref:Uncharacterized protein n=1 Tax=Saccharothrix violaceirubra TaxID=413306 RepID=A0A7W7T0P2_9PSEU|nr:hypothetical protein [Saccharothrix violaceirubra]MBB4964434.1 hypothetical protein [Saccharothrix violaceirubra]
MAEPDLVADLRSADPDRIAAALAALDHAERTRRFLVVPPPEPAALDAFDTVPEQVLLHFVALWLEYPAFQPAPDIADVHRTIVDAVLRHGGPTALHRVALGLRTCERPAVAARDLVRDLHDRDLTDAEQDRASVLLDDLLDVASTHRAVADGVVYMALFGAHTRLVDTVRRRLGPEDRARVDAARAD